MNDQPVLPADYTYETMDVPMIEEVEGQIVAVSPNGYLIIEADGQRYLTPMKASMLEEMDMPPLDLPSPGPQISEYAQC